MKMSCNAGHLFKKALAAVLFLCLVPGCATTPVIYHEVSESFNASDIQRVGVLVIRMGNYFPSATTPLKPDTVFSYRTPVHGWHGAVSEKTRNVYIEDEVRLKESFPYYPATTEKPIHFLTDHYTFKFYRNFSPDIYQMLHETFAEKGYDVVDIAGLAENWRKPLSESTIAEIMANSKKHVDAMAVFQYLDVGDSTSRVGSVSGDRKGFTNFEYSLYMFDAQTSEELLYYKKDCFVGAVLAMLNDPEITENPQYKDKIKRYEKGFANWVTYYVVNELPDEVVTRKLMSYIKDGFEMNDENFGTVKWTGLSSVIPGR